MRYGAIKYFDIANGTGIRTSLFVSGCTHHCKGCFQPETWSFDYGQPFSDDVQDQIIESIAQDYVSGLAVLGGEPMEPSNQEALLPFLQRAKSAYPEKTIWLYTGDTFEDLINPNSPRHTAFTTPILECLDVMVDGKFEESLKDITLRFRGSSNQRLIDVPSSLKQKNVVPWMDQDIYSSHSM